MCRVKDFDLNLKSIVLKIDKPPSFFMANSYCLLICLKNCLLLSSPVKHSSSSQYCLEIVPLSLISKHLNPNLDFRYLCGHTVVSASFSFDVNLYYVSAVHSSQFCPTNATQNRCDAADTLSFSWTYYIVFLLSQVIAGAGGAPLFNLCIAYLDENVSPRYTSIYIAVYYASGFVGPSLGFVIAGQLLSTYVDFDQVCPLVTLVRVNWSEKLITDLLYHFSQKTSSSLRVIRAGLGTGG